MVDNMSRNAFCCCCRCCLWRRHRQDLVYNPVSNGHSMRRRPSLRCVISETNGDTATTTITPASPVWQPLTNRQLPNMDWPTGSYDPLNDHLTLMDDDADSGWDDDCQVSSRQIATRWLAEVSIVEGRLDGQRPHIHVKPISALREREATISITAL